LKLDAFPSQTKKENKEKLNTYKIPLVDKKIINIKSMLIKTITILLFSLSPFLKEPCVKIGTAGSKWSMKKNCYIVTIPDEKETKTHRGIDGIKWMDDWHVIGPFPSGSRELGMDPFLSFDDISKKEFDFEKSYPSELVDGGMISWKKIKSKNDGWVNVSFPDVRWQPLQDHHGWAGIIFKGWAIGEFSVEKSGKYLAQCLSTSKFLINNQIVNGDIYADGYGWFLVDLSEGEHLIKIPLSGFESDSFKCHFKKPNDNFFILPGDTIVPDLLEGEIVSNYFSIPIINTSNDWINKININIKKPLELVSETIEVKIAPGQVYPIAIKLKNIEQYFEHCPLESTITISTNGENHQNHDFQIRCRKLDQSFRYTFIGQDGSVQYASARAPLRECEEDFLNDQILKFSCPVILTTHGAGVKAEGQAEAYSSKENAWVLAPTGRRRFGYDWEGPGRINALNALNALPTHIKSLNKRKHDPYRILFTGHSMGGHGAWSLSLRYPDRAIASAPAAGWIKFQHYVSYFLRPGDSYIDPILKGILETSIAEHNNDLYASNMKGIPVLARVGGDDQSVPPWHLRRMSRILLEEGVHSTVSEIPGKGHWWGGVVDDKEMNDFFNSHIESKPQTTNKFSITVLNTSSFESKGGIKPLQLNTPYRVGKIQVNVQEKTHYLKTLNIKSLKILAKEANIYNEQINQINIDGENFSIEGESYFCKLEKSNTWHQCTKEEIKSKEERMPENMGPARQILEKDFIIVYGSNGSKEQTKNRIERAVFIANDWFLRGRGSVEIYSDKEIMNLNIQNKNLILLGGPKTNIVSNMFIQDNSFISYEHQKDAINIDGAGSFQNPGTGFQFLTFSEYKNNKTLALIIGGIDEKGFSNTFQIFPFSSGVTVPDFMIINNEFKSKGSGGILAAGFWSNDWSFNPAIGYSVNQEK